jgi:hypothetical protein
MMTMLSRQPTGRIRCALLLILVLSLTTQAWGRPPRPTSEGNTQNLFYKQFELNIPGVTEEFFTPEFWLHRVPEPDKILMTPAQVARYNQRNLRECPVMKDIRTFPRFLSGEKVREYLAKTSARPKKKLYKNGDELNDAYFAALEQTMNPQAIPTIVTTKFAITVRRTIMRTFPTADRVFSEPDDCEFDRFIETALYPNEAIAVLHTSADGNWVYAQAYNYLAWLPARDVAFADRAAIFEHLDNPEFLVITEKQIFTAYNPYRPEISELQCDMGAKFPLAKTAEIPLEIDGQHPAGNYVIKLPTRTPKGGLVFRLALISRSEHVSLGYLPLTRRNTIRQAFKFLGQRYGWGGQFQTRDCSAFIMDIFRSMGLLLPRNANEQGKLALGIRHEMTPETTLAERMKLFDRLPPTTPIYMDGHAMLYLWKLNQDYFIIHDFAGMTLPDETGAMKKSKTRSVFVTPLLATYLSSGKKYIEGLYTAREFTRQEP